jgi:hypothetical protein
MAMFSGPKGKNISVSKEGRPKLTHTIQLYCYPKTNLTIFRKVQSIQIFFPRGIYNKKKKRIDYYIKVEKRNLVVLEN